MAPPRRSEADLEVAYAEGFKTGSTWTHDHVPGGPWYDKDDASDRAYNAEWRRGWANGKAQRSAV